MPTPDFYFSFRGKDSRDMTREELLEVIEHMVKERNWWRDEAKSFTQQSVAPLTY
jgi:hypothetical protein